MAAGGRAALPGRGRRAGERQQRARGRTGTGRAVRGSDCSCPAAPAVRPCESRPGGTANEVRELHQKGERGVPRRGESVWPFGSKVSGPASGGEPCRAVPGRGDAAPGAPSERWRGDVCAPSRVLRRRRLGVKPVTLNGKSGANGFLSDCFRCRETKRYL